MISRRGLLAVLTTDLALAADSVPLLNHFYATVDSVTYAAIEASAFLREQFAPFEKRTTVRNDSTYSGLYFYGDETYFEFFEENHGDRKLGDAGMALGIETPGGSAGLRAKWEKQRPSLTTMVTRQLDGTPVDWFHMTSYEETRAKSAVEGLRFFAMEYEANFVKRWNPASNSSIAQRAILAAYCEKLNLSQVREKSLLGNVRQLEIAAPEERVRVRASQLEGAGWKLKAHRKGILCVGPNASVDLRFAPEPQGVKAVEFTLKNPGREQTLKIGASTLEIRGKQAIWRFGP